MRAGDIVLVDFGLPEGSEPGFVRPAVVVTANAVLEGRPRTVHMVPVTSNITRNLPTEIPITSAHLPSASVAQAHLSQTLSARRIKSSYEDNIGAITLAQIRATIADLLDLPL